jgi:hypothetical protein
MFRREMAMLEMLDRGHEDNENIQEHLRRVEMHIAMMMRMNRELDDDHDDFMYPPIFGERGRRDEEVKIDLLGIN